MCVAFTCLLTSTHAHAENSTDLVDIKEVEYDVNVVVDDSVVVAEDPIEYVEPEEENTDLTYEDVVALYAEAVEAYNTSMEVYQGTINTTFLTIFRDIVASLGVNDDYVLFRSSDYTYSMLVGDLDYFSTGEFVLASDGRLYTVTQVQGSYNYNSYYSYSVEDVSSYSVTVDDYLVYSNLGNYPTLIDRGVNYAFVSLLVLCVIGLCLFIRPLFAFVMRSGRS